MDFTPLTEQEIRDNKFLPIGTYAFTGADAMREFTIRDWARDESPWEYVAAVPTRSLAAVMLTCNKGPRWEEDQKAQTIALFFFPSNEHVNARDNGVR